MTICRFSFINGEVVKWLKFLNVKIEYQGSTWHYYSKDWVDLRFAYFLKILYDDVRILTKRSPRTFKNFSNKYSKKWE